MPSFPTITPDMNIIGVGKESPVAKNTRDLINAEITARTEHAFPSLSARTQVTMRSTQHTVDQLWPEQKSFGPIQIRGHKETGLYIFDTQSKTITGSPVRDVLDAAQDTSGTTYVFVYGNILGGDQNDDRYAWISTKDGSILPGTVNDEPVRRLPEGLVALTA